MKRWLLPAAAFCWVCGGGCAGAWSYGEFISCDAINPMPKITFKSSYGKLVHDLSQPLSTLNQNAHAQKEPGWLRVGYATQSLSSSIWVKAKVKKIDDYTTCVLPDEVEVFLGYQKPMIYVAKEYKDDLCKFSVVIRHEQVHQRINKLALDYFLPLADKALRNAIADVKGIKVPSPEQSQQGVEMLYKYYQFCLQPILDEMIRAVDAEQAKLDTLTSYKMQWDMCEKFKERQERDKYLKEMEEKLKAEL